MKRKLLICLAIVLFVVGCSLMGISLYNTYTENNTNNKSNVKKNTNNIIDNDDKTTDVKTEYYVNDKNAIITVSNPSKILNDKYIVDFADRKLKSIKNINGDVLYESENELEYYGNTYRTSIYEGMDGNLYYECYTDNNSLQVYKLVNGKFELIIENDLEKGATSDEDGKHKYATPIVKSSFMYGGYLFGFIINDTYMIDLDGNEYDFVVESRETRLSYDQEYSIVNTKYIPVSSVDYDNSQISSSNDTEIRLFDIENKKILDGIVYNDIIATNEDVFFVRKNGKYGAINHDNKVLIPFEYDFIDNYYDIYFLINDNTITLMDENFKALTSFTADVMYYARPCCNDHSTFEVNKLGDNYLIYTYKNYNAEDENMHFISSNGNYKLVTDLFKGFSYYKVNNDKLVVFYDDNFKIFDSNLNLIYTQGIGDKIQSVHEIVGNILIYSLNDEITYYDIENTIYVDSNNKVKILSINDINVYLASGKIRIYDKDKLIAEADYIDSFDEKNNKLEIYDNDRYIFVLDK